ncbi:hypothetical protein E4U57_004943 [Claviceps arundinis]|uniref:Uncharacterized protein n=1 Tax=Claviceps arundinis TaxID=1623583 RepID=A0ABQ7PIG4_9HYPO|nr:hypothetical protein E4U57_004943 [Claviceps arundinis]
MANTKPVTSPGAKPAAGAGGNAFGALAPPLTGSRQQAQWNAWKGEMFENRKQVETGV